MNLNKISLLLIAVTFGMFTVTSCTDDPIPAPAGPVTPVDTTGTDTVVDILSSPVYISCEGGFGANNASLSKYNKDSMTVVNSVFADINGFMLGDVFQSISKGESSLFLTVNNSANVELVDPITIESQSVVTGLGSPRFTLQVSNDKAYVSQIFTNEVAIVDLNTSTVSGAIDVGGWSEGMLMYNGLVYITQNDGNQVKVFDPATDLEVTSITVTSGPKDIVIDANENIWVLGSSYDADFNVVDAVVTHISTVDNTVLGVYDIPQPWSYTLRLAIDGEGDDLYILNNDVYHMEINDSSISSSPIITNGQVNYGLGVDPSSGDIYLGAGDFTNSGTVYRYDESGVELDQFTVGVAPNGFFFEY